MVTAYLIQLSRINDLKNTSRVYARALLFFKMGHGGRRNGAGRKPGAKTTKTREAAEFILASGITPLGYFQGLLEGTVAFDEVKFEAAKAAAPYVHARLAAIEAKHDISDALADLLKVVDGRTRGIPQSDRSVFGLAMAANQSLLDH